MSEQELQTLFSSEDNLVKLFKNLQRKFLTRIIVTIVSSLIVLFVGGNWTIDKFSKIKKKADITYVDSIYRSILDLTRIMENRTLALENLVTAEKDRNEERVIEIKKQLEELDKKWAEHMRYHLEKTRGLSDLGRPITYYGQDISFLFKQDTINEQN